MSVKLQELQIEARRWEVRRAPGAGIIESFGATFFLLIAIELHRAGTTMQAWVAAGGSLGMLLSPVVLYVVRRSGMAVNRASAILMAASAVALVPSQFLFSAWVYVVGGTVAMVCAMGSIPLITQMYQQNFPESGRGGVFGEVNRIKVLVLAFFSALAGWMLKLDLQRADVYLGVLAAAFAYSAWCVGRMPGRPLAEEPGHYPYRSLRLLRRDGYFRWLILMWMLLGFGNLMMVPLKVKVLVEPVYGFEYSPLMVAVITGVIPSLTIFAFTRMWGGLFDRMNFALLRLLLNILFVLSILIFFLSGHWAGFVAGSFLSGLGFAGGNVVWSLWVTRVAPDHEVADYMSVHILMTGLRGLLAPMVSIPMAALWPLGGVVALSTGLILVSCLMLIPEWKGPGLHRS
ncbi:MAG: MFS transporter [Candidatus Methylacidiphilales bacterium]